MEGSITFGSNVLQVEGVEVKYDIVPVSSSLALVIGDKDSASIVQQLYYWLEQGYGEVIDGVRWIYKSVKEWITEVFPTYTPYQLGKMMKQLSDRGIIRREKLFTKHQIQKGDRFWWQPKNQTYYYTLNYEKLQDLGKKFVSERAKKERTKDTAEASDNAQTPENSVSLKTQILSNEEIEDTKFSDCAKFNTKNTSIENNSKDKSHPTLPSECDDLDSINQRKDSFNTSELSNELRKEENIGFNSEVVAEEISSADVDNKINQNIDTTPDVAFTRPKLKASKQPKREKKAPWNDEGQFKRFYRALIQALPIVANSHSPQGLAQTIIRQLRCGIPHSYWDDFIAGLPIGTSTKPEWEVEPGVPYPMFIEYLTEKLKAGNNSTSDEQTRNEVFRILAQPRQARAFWGQFKRSVVNAARQVERDRALGISNPATPVWTKERVEPSIEEARHAGEKIMAMNGNARSAIKSANKPQLESKRPASSSILDPWNDDGEIPQVSCPPLRELLAERLGKKNLKGFTKQMPKVSKSEIEAKERANKKPKTNIAVMSIAEINDYLSDPILRKQIAPQLIRSSYQLITDELGEIIAVEPEKQE